ncbi:MAG: hypothetical protein OEY11_09610 [Gammaproteobacteria bacterium]|nr:hypothetical protein [Gammaproteobacteria bacterium]
MIKKFGLQKCKKCYLFLMVLGFVILITAINEKRYSISSDKLPWQISLTDDGKSEVFGIILDQTSMRDALTTLQTFPETALFEHKNGRRNLEAYISSISLSGLTAKMILEYGIDDETLQRYRQHSIDKEGTPSGAFKYKLNEEDGLQAMQYPVISISYIPYAQFDDEIILQRFGIAAETITLNDRSSILLYPELGLSITYNTDEKEILQYVAPENFQRLKKLALSQTH